MNLNPILYLKIAKESIGSLLNNCHLRLFRFSAKVALAFTSGQYGRSDLVHL